MTDSLDIRDSEEGVTRVVNVYTLMSQYYTNLRYFSVTYWLSFQISGARRDADNYLWVTGRVDDMLNVSGHLMSTAEVESVLVDHEDVAEAAVVSQPHPVKGECLYCFVTPKSGVQFQKKLADELKVKGI